MLKCFIFLLEKLPLLKSLLSPEFFVRVGLSWADSLPSCIIVHSLIFKSDICLYAQVLSELARQESPCVSEQGYKDAAED